MSCFLHFQRVVVLLAVSMLLFFLLRVLALVFFAGLLVHFVCRLVLARACVHAVGHGSASASVRAFLCSQVVTGDAFGWYFAPLLGVLSCISRMLWDGILNLLGVLSRIPGLLRKSKCARLAV